MLDCSRTLKRTLLDGNHNSNMYDPLNKLYDRVNLMTNAKFLVAMRFGDTPVLIPNTMVKT